MRPVAQIRRRSDLLVINKTDLAVMARGVSHKH